MKRRLIFVLALLSILSFAPPVGAQNAGLVTLTVNVEAGFAGRFRDNMWTPLAIRLENAGTRSFTGEIVARPERSRGLTHTSRTPVSIGPDTQQALTLYVGLRSFADTVRIEVVTDEGLIAAEAETSVRAVLPQERLYVRVSDTLGRTANLSAAAAYGQSVTQSDVFTQNLPDHQVGLQAADVLYIAAADTGALTTRQRDAIEDYVTHGGHLIVVGGAQWQPTAAGLQPLLPIVPDSSVVSSDFAALRAWSSSAVAIAQTDSVVSTGSLQESGRVLVSDSSGIPLIARRELGAGIVDYVAFDPASAPFTSWPGLDTLWLSMITSRAPRPAWNLGFLNLSQGYTAIEILPGVTALPEALTMLAFLLAYVALIGPVNYFVLSRIGRREFAWLTVPGLIAVFTIAAWVTGFNLRGTDVTLSRLSIIESWPDAEDAHLRQLVGVLSPRRANYDLSVEDGRALRPLLRTAAGGFFTNQASPLQISQSDTFSAEDFSVDASFMAGFVTDGAIQRPDINGRVSVVSRAAEDILQVRGSVRNELTVPLLDPVILTRAGAHRLDSPLMPGEIRLIDVDLVRNPATPIPAAPVQNAVAYYSPSQSRFISRGRESMTGPDQTARDIIGAESYRSAVFFGLPQTSSTIDQAEQRRQTFLSTFIVDQFSTTSRGDGVYLVGWTESAPTEEIVSSSARQAVDTSLYIVKLDADLEAAPGESDRISVDQFTWLLLEDEAATESTPNLISYLARGKVSYRFTPVPTSVLAEVDELIVRVERGSAQLQNTELSVFDWNTGTYVPMRVTEQDLRIRNPQRYLGPNNAVQIELDRFIAAGTASITRIGVEQIGTRG
ncbi:MAG: hypothetical protein IPM16_05920 [Chloroflexi bacterium]|nr:hypothetical protein [Chloroflexota bacterium]